MLLETLRKRFHVLLLTETVLVPTVALVTLVKMRLGFPNTGACAFANDDKKQIEASNKNTAKNRFINEIAGV